MANFPTIIIVEPPKRNIPEVLVQESVQQCEITFCCKDGIQLDLPVYEGTGLFNFDPILTVKKAKKEKN